MSIRDLQAARDGIEEGDDVLVRKGNDHYRGVVLEKMARMAKVRLANGGKVEVHSFTNLRKVVDTAQALVEPMLRARELPRHADRNSTRDMPINAVHMISASIAVATKDNVQNIIPVGEKTPPGDDVRAWLDMGVTLAKQIRAEADALELREKELIRESNLCLEEASECAQEQKRLEKKLLLLAKLAE